MKVRILKEILNLNHNDDDDVILVYQNQYNDSVFEPIKIVVLSEKHSRTAMIVGESVEDE